MNNTFERYYQAPPNETEWQAREEQLDRLNELRAARLDNSGEFTDVEENWVEITEFRRPAQIERMQMSLNFGEVA